MATNIKFNSDYREKIKLNGNTQLRMRLLRTNDKQHFVNAFEELSPQSRYTRFLGVKKGMSEQELVYFTDIDQNDHFALCALALDDSNNESQIVGITRFIRLYEDNQSAEVSIAVIDSEQGKGIGRCLLERLFKAASERGIKRLRFECLSENQYLQRLIKKHQKHVKLTRKHEVLMADVEIPKSFNHEKPFSNPILEELSALIIEFSSKTLLLYSNLNTKLVNQAIDSATKYKFLHSKLPLNRSKSKNVNDSIGGVDNESENSIINTWTTIGR